MQKLLSLSRMIPAAAFLGYAAVANVAVMERDWLRGPDADRGWMNGEVADAFGGRYERALPHRSLAQGWIGAARYVLAGEGRDGVLVGDDGWLFTTEETRLADPGQIARAADHVAAVRAQLRAIGSDLVLVPVPAKLDVVRAAAGQGFPAGEMANQYADFVTALARRGIALVDARAALVAAHGDHDPAFLRTDTHWSPRGAASVAAAVAASRLVPTGDAALRRVDAPAVAFPGDLVSFVTTDAIAPRLGLNPETVVPWVAEDARPAAGGIFAAEAASPDIVLVGTSYSADPNWSFAPALSLALRRPVLNRAEEGLGPIRTMADFVAAHGPARAAPATVIWEFPIRYLADPGIWPDAPPAIASASLKGAFDG